MKTLKEELAATNVPTKKQLFVVFGFTDEEFEKLAEDIWGNFPEASSGSALQCVGWNYKEWKFSFVDSEAEDEKGVHPPKPKTLVTTREKCLGAVASFLVLKMRGQLKGISIEDYHDAGEYDAIAADAIAQLAVLGDVIYG